jgi:F0F1-type ATP synthase assembly protein I
LVLGKIPCEHLIDIVMRVVSGAVIRLVMMMIGRMMFVFEHQPVRLQIGMPRRRTPGDGKQNGDQGANTRHRGQEYQEPSVPQEPVSAPNSAGPVKAARCRTSMLFLVVKYAVSALVIVVVSEVAKRSDRAGALLASLPLVTVMAMIWLHVEQQPEAKIANHAYYTFWYVLPTMPMFLLIPWLLNRGVAFWPALLAGCACTIACFVASAMILRRFGIGLLP